MLINDTPSDQSMTYELECGTELNLHAGIEGEAGIIFARVKTEFSLDYTPSRKEKVTCPIAVGPGNTGAVYQMIEEVDLIPMIPMKVPDNLGIKDMLKENLCGRLGYSSKNIRPKVWEGLSKIPPEYMEFNQSQM